MMENILYMASLALIALLSLVAVLHNSFNDNLVQRVGLSLACLGAMARFWHGLDGLELPAPKYLFTYGIAIYGLGTAYKCWQFRHHISGQS